MVDETDWNVPEIPKNRAYVPEMSERRILTGVYRKDGKNVLTESTGMRQKNSTTDAKRNSK